jgi:hypothetical protein
MNKNTKMIIGVGVVAVAGYLLWMQSQKKSSSFANLTARTRMGTLDAGTCPCKKVKETKTLTDGGKVDVCADGHMCPQGLTNIF